MKIRALFLALITCTLAPTCKLPRSLTPLDYDVVDAAYSRSASRVLLLSSNPPTLHFFDPRTRTETRLGLDADPTRIALSADGTRAVVGHDRLLSHVDVQSESILRTYPVSARVIDVVVPENGRYYAFLETGGDDPEIAIVDSESGAEQIVRGGGTRAIQRPGTDSVYIVNSRIGPQRLTSIDIGEGGANRLHRSPYHGRHEPCGRIWFSEDGRQLFTACGETLRASSSRDQDMRFAGALANATRVAGLDHSAAAHHIVAIPAPPFAGDPLTDSKLQLYHDHALEYRGSVDLPPFKAKRRPVPAHGRFVFFDAIGANLIVVQQADEAAGLAEDFAIATLPFDPVAFAGAPPTPPPPTVPQPFPFFDRPIVDAEWSAELDRIVFVSSDPQRLHVYDPETGEDREVALPFAPNSVSISSSGDRAAVAHDGGHVSLVDLPSVSLVTTYAAFGDVLDVVLTEDRIFPFHRATIGDGDLLAIDLETGALERTVTVSVSGDSKATLDATGEFLYIATGYTNGDWLNKIDISQRPPRYVRGLIPYPDTRGFCGATWLATDGRRLFTRCGAVYRASLDPASDITFEGSLGAVSPARHVSDSSATGLIAAIPGIPDYDAFGFAVIPGTGWNGDPDSGTRVKLFDSTSLELLSDVPLTPFALVSGTAPARGRFAFFDRSGERLHVIVEADPQSGIANGFGVQSFDLF